MVTTKIGDGDPQQNNNNITEHLHEGTLMQRNNNKKPNQTKPNKGTIVQQNNNANK